MHDNKADRKLLTTWIALREVLIDCFETFNRTKTARHEMAKEKQLNEVSWFNDDFLQTVVYIPNLSVEEQTYRFSRAPKLDVWKKLCTTDYKSLSELMRDAE